MSLEICQSRPIYVMERVEKTGKPKGSAMTEVLNTNQLNLELHQKKFILMGGKIKNVQKKLSANEIAQIKKSYRRMYFAFTSINWANGMTLGMAWQKALEQMNSFVATKSKIKNHPVNDELMKIHAEFRREQSKHIMTSEYANEKLSDKYKKSFFDYGNQKLKKYKSVIDGMYKQYMPQPEITKQQKTSDFGIGMQKTQQILQQLLLQQLKERAA